MSMIEQEIERKISDFQALGMPKYIPRESGIHLVDNMVSSIIGARRAGKSFRLLQVADELIAQGVLESADQVCLMDFDNPILSNMGVADLKLIQNTFLKLNPEFSMDTPLLFLMDEIHKIPGWEEYVIDLSRNINWKVIVTGSSSKLLRQDIATELRGKAIPTTIYTLSFGEFLKFNDFKHSPLSTKGQAEIRRLFDEYLKWGAYPAIPSVGEFAKEALLREYFDTMILRDIIQRYDVSKPRQCIFLYNFLASNIAKPHTLQSAFGYLKQNGFNTSRETVRDYIGRAVDSWFLFTVPIYSDSAKEQERNYKKIYAIDWALANRNSIVWDGSLSQALENMVFIHLHRAYHRVQYYLTREKRKEVDFIAADSGGHPIAAIQVCMDISRAEVLERELEPIIATARYFGTKENLIVTYNQERDFTESGVAVKAIPAWKWMLSLE